MRTIQPIPPVFIIITLVITPDILHLAPALPHFPRSIEELKIEFAYYSNKDSHIIDYCMPKPSDGYFETQQHSNTATQQQHPKTASTVDSVAITDRNQEGVAIQSSHSR